MQNHLLVIGVSEYGARAVDQLLERHTLIKEQYGKHASFEEGYFHTGKISTVEEAGQMLNKEAGFVLVVSDFSDETSAVLQRLRNTIKKDFCVGIGKNEIESKMFDSLVLVDDETECFNAVNLFHDFLLIPTLIGAGEDDVKSVCRDRVLHCVETEKNSDFSSDQKLFLSSVHAKFHWSKSLMVGIYGDKESGMHFVAEAMKSISSSLKKETKLIVNSFPVEPNLKDKRKVVVLY